MLHRFANRWCRRYICILINSICPSHERVQLMCASAFLALATQSDVFRFLLENTLSPQLGTRVTCNTKCMLSEMHLGFCSFHSSKFIEPTIVGCTYPRPLQCYNTSAPHVPLSSTVTLLSLSSTLSRAHRIVAPLVSTEQTQNHLNTLRSEEHLVRCRYVSMNETKTLVCLAVRDMNAVQWMRLKVEDAFH